MDTRAAHRIGEGPHSVIALSGIFGSATAWRPLWPYLDGSRFTFYFADYRGYGSRIEAEGDYSIDEAASDVLSTADDLGLESFSLVGHSMGGSIMQKVLAKAPDRVNSLFGISPVPASGAPFDDQTWALFLDAVGNPDSRRAIIDFSSGSRLTKVWLDAMVRHSLENSTKAAFAGYLHAFSRTDFHDEIAGNTTPVTTLVGRHDPANNEEAMLATYAKWYPNYSSIVLSDVGHYATDEIPVLLATEIEKAALAAESRDR
jgi:pimeloyl-ACP methyl ester carboxylesterase